MTLPTITRGQGWRDDMILASNWTLDSGVALTTDGDNATITGSTGANGANQTVPGSLSTVTYPLVMLRAKGTGTFQLAIVYTVGSDNPTYTFSGTGYQTFQTTLTTSKTISSVKIFNQSGTLIVDFLFFFKELLTFPSVTKAILVPQKRYVTKLQIIGRDGDIYQDLGSSSPEFHLGGNLITTSQYSADDWNRVFEGLRLEQSTTQADGNPTWQWFTSDLWSRKVLIMDYTPQDVPGRLRNTLNDYGLRLVEWDTIGQTVASVNAIS